MLSENFHALLKKTNTFGTSQTGATSEANSLNHKPAREALYTLVWPRLIYELVWRTLRLDCIYDFDTERTPLTDLIILHKPVNFETSQ